MTAIKRILGTAIGFVMVLAFTGTITAIVFSLAVPDKTALREFWEEVRCIAGYPVAGSQCAQDTIRRADDAVAAANQRRAEAEEAQRAAEDALARGDLEFAQGPALKDGVSLVVGTIYLDATNRTGLVRSFCWAIIDEGGLDPRVGLAIRDASGRVRVLPLSDDDIALMELQPVEAAAAHASCPWPGGII
ncbi:hypothetical protein [Jannaschia sp. M317]|uniref:hypothetical protein n=1 Tax=Jannaschia sp. M317 TaxID=2867011 RepID=UPI0021A3148E|nr:hypothetical protein [Jannaschia sp. M317]UWQ19059.1 hypothetical protein K3551_07255 [Jannaschia sp. M317]